MAEHPAHFVRGVRFYAVTYIYLICAGDILALSRQNAHKAKGKTPRGKRLLGERKKVIRKLPKSIDKSR